jgi:hypothetical protein
MAIVLGRESISEILVLADLDCRETQVGPEALATPFAFYARKLTEHLETLFKK